MDIFKLKIEESELETLFREVKHDIFQKSLIRHWKVIGQDVTAQSVCWLFCWAKTGMNSPSAMEQSRQIFDKIFKFITFTDFDEKVPHEWAREARYRTENIDEELKNLLSIDQTNRKKVIKYVNDDFENKKEFEKYRANKNNLKGFIAAERFIQRLETIKNGFYISPRTNLHCYYKDRYLFYLYDFNLYSIKIRQQFNRKIIKGTYDYSVYFFNILMRMINPADSGIQITKIGDCGFEISNSDNANKYFDIIYKAMLEIANQIDNHTKGKQEDFENKVAISRQLTSEERLNRLKNSPEYPPTLEKTTITFNRNPDVIAEVLERANGICEFCKQAAPFIRISDGTPFLEVHHVVFLSDGGKDTVDNAIALCPNCHRGVITVGTK